MLWEEMLIDRHLTAAEVVATLSTLFAVSPDAVLCVDDVTEARVSEDIRVVCERMSVKGDFAMRLSIYLHDAALEQLNRTSMIEQFCDLLHCTCVISDGSVNPYAMLLVQGSGRQEPVFLDPERFDADAYVLERLRTTPRHGERETYA